DVAPLNRLRPEPFPLPADHDQRLQAAGAAEREWLATLDVLQLEVRAAGEGLALGCPYRLLGPREAGGVDWLNWPAVPVDARDGFFDVQRARLTLGVAAVPIEEAEGGVARLLNFGHEHTAADRVDRAGRQIN